jgi:hypothetical protein
VIAQSGTETLKHKPCRLLGNANGAVEFHAGNAILAIDQHPKRCHPFVESKSGILKDRSNLDRELLIASTAEPEAPSLDEIMLIGIAAGAAHVATGPAKANGIVECPLRIGEVNDGIL